MSHVDSETVRTVSPHENAGLISENSGSALETLRDQKRKMLAANRATWWALADLDAQAVAEHGAQVIDDLAEDEQCSKAHIKQRLALRSVFGEHRADLERVNFSVLRAAANAAHRTGRDPWDLLRMGVVAGWHVSDFANLDRTATERVEFDGDCGDCGLEVRVRCKKPGAKAMLRGDRLTCPFCAATVPGTPYLGSLA